MSIQLVYLEIETLRLLFSSETYLEEVPILQVLKSGENMESKTRIVTSHNLVSIQVGASTSTAIQLMTEKRIRHLAVVNDNNEIVGVISSRVLSNLKSPELVPVEFFVSKIPSFVDQNSPLRSSIMKMLSEKISSLLITDETGRAIGIVTTDDLLWYLAHIVGQNTDAKFSFSSLFDLQTIGEAARQISMAGI